MGRARRSPASRATTASYWTDWDEAGTSAIWRAPLAGGAIERVYPPGEERLPGTWPIEVDGGYVYFANGGGLYRLPSAGGMVQRIQDGAIRGFALTRWGGHAWIYWTDLELGGLVWRQRLD